MARIHAFGVFTYCDDIDIFVTGLGTFERQYWAYVSIQTEFLAQVSAQQFGLDVSARAISRARERIPRAQFHVGDLFDQPWGDQQHRFDLITACDVLYYMSDIPAALARMRHLARAGLVTFYAPASARVAPYLGVIEGVRHDWIFHGNTVWLVAWWRDGDG